MLFLGFKTCLLAIYVYLCFVLCDVYVICLFFYEVVFFLLIHVSSLHIVDNHP